MLDEPLSSLEAMDHLSEPSYPVSGRAPDPQDLNASVAFWTDIVIICVAGLASFADVLDARAHPLEAILKYAAAVYGSRRQDGSRGQECCRVCGKRAVYW